MLLIRYRETLLFECPHPLQTVIVGLQRVGDVSTPHDLRDAEGHLGGVAQDPFLSGTPLIVSDGCLEQTPQATKHGLLHFAQPVFNVATSLQALQQQQTQVTADSEKARARNSDDNYILSIRSIIKL